MIDILEISFGDSLSKNYFIRIKNSAAYIWWQCHILITGEQL